MFIQVNWTQFKEFVVSRRLIIQMIETEGYYYLRSADSFFMLETRLDRNPTDTTELNDFEQNFKSKTNAKIDTRSPDGKTVQQSTPRKLGTYAYYSGSGDNPDDALNIGGTDDNELIYGSHTIGQDLVQSIYKDLNSVANETHIRTGLIQWKNTTNDYITFEIVPRLTTYEAGENTNYNIYGDTLIIPAAGNGLVTPISIKLVQCVANEFGTKPAGFWNADFNTTTGEFENITAAPSGNGDYNMFIAEMVLSRFVNKFMLLGDSLFLLPSEDITQIPHGGRVKITTKTRGDDHNWSWNANINLYRKRTC